MGGTGLCDMHHWSVFLPVLISLLRQGCTPDLSSRLQALSADLFLRRTLVRGDPSNSKQSVILVIVNLDSVSDFHLASATAKLHSTIADIESVNEMTIRTASDPDGYTVCSDNKADYIVGNSVSQTDQLIGSL